MYPQYMYILLYSICVFHNLFGVMCILLYILMWCKILHLLSIGVCILLYVGYVIPHIYVCVLSICAFCSMYLFGVTIFYRSIVNWSGIGVDVCSVYVHCYM